MSITIRPAKTIEDCRHIEELVQLCWGRDPLEAIPASFSMAVIKNGGVVLLAFDQQEPVGFSYAFFAWDAHYQLLKMHSHMAGVIPAYRDSGLGARLKWAQRAAIMGKSAEINLVTWTYDPLETRNARLNLRKLGAISHSYIPDAYGSRDDNFAAGLPTDRFQVEWWINSDWVNQHHRQPKTLSAEAATYRQQAGYLNAVSLRGDLLYPDNLVDNWGDERYMLAAIPSDIQYLKKRDLQLASAWRDHTRTLFETAFANDFTAIDLIVDSDRCYYLLEKEWRQDER